MISKTTALPLYVDSTAVYYFSTFLLQQNLSQMFALLIESYVMIYIAITAQNCGYKFRHKQIQCLSVEPLAATRRTLVE